MSDKLTDEAQAMIKDSIRILKEDGHHVAKAWKRLRDAEANEPPKTEPSKADPPKTDNPSDDPPQPPPAKEGEPNEPAQKKGLWWA